MTSILYGETKQHDQKVVFRLLFTLLVTNTEKIHAKHFIWGHEMILLETCYLSVFSVLSTKQQHYQMCVF